MDALPIEALVQKAKEYAIKYGTQLVLTEIAAITGPISGFFAPIINFILQDVVNWIVTMLVNKSDNMMFGINTDLITSDQGKDFREAVAKVLLLPDDVPDDQWSNADEEANHKLFELVNFAA